MIINIPLQIDEATFEQKVREDYSENVKQLLLAKVDQILKERDNRYYRSGRDPKVGLENMVYESLDIYMNNHKDEIIEMAADKLAERLAKSGRCIERVFQ